MRLSRLVRPIVGSATARRVFGWLVAGYIRLVFRTSRWRYVGFEERERLAESGERFLVVLWHNRLAMMPVSFDTGKWKLTILTSTHRDAQLVRGVFERFAIGSIAVRSNELDLSAAREVARAVRGGSFIGITPDGPRGPRQRIKPNLISLARLCSARVTLVTYSVKRRVLLRSWDRFNLPLPFNQGVFLWSPGVVVPKKLDEAGLEEWRLTLERGLAELTDRADAMMGHAPIAPAAGDEPAGRPKRRDRQAEAAS